MLRKFLKSLCLNKSMEAIFYLKPSGRIFYTALVIVYFLTVLGSAVAWWFKVLPSFVFGLVLFGSSVLLLVSLVLVALYFQLSYIKVENDSVLLKKGLVNRKSTLIPFNRIDNVKTNANLVEMLFGLKTLMIDTSGSDEIEIVLDNIPVEQVERFMDYYNKWREVHARDAA